MIINSQIKELHKMLCFMKESDLYLHNSCERMISIGLLCHIHDINHRLEELNKELDTNITSEGVNIDYDLFLSEDYWPDNIIFNDKCDIKTHFSSGLINTIPDYFPVNDKNYQFQDTLVQPLKTAFHQFLDEEKLTFGDMAYALNKSLAKMKALLQEMREKATNPHGFQYKKVWDDLLDYFNDDRTIDEYKCWKSDHGMVDFKTLRYKQLREILQLVENRFFRYYEKPMLGEMKNCLLVQQEDYLPAGTVLTDGLKEECAKFERFIEWKEKTILVLNYEMLGEYIARQGAKLEDEDYLVIVDFDRMMDYIHEDMADLKPNLAKYLKRYEERKIHSLLNDCAAILNSCQKHLKDDIRNTFLREFLNKMLFDKEMKQEARAMLGGKSKKKYLCLIVAALDCFHIFKADSVKADLAVSLSDAFGNKPSKASIVDYIDKYQRQRKGTLYEWTKANIDDLKSNPYNPFEGII